MSIVLLFEKVFGSYPDSFVGIHEVDEDELLDFLIHLPTGTIDPVVLDEDGARKLLYELGKMLEEVD